MRLRNPASSTGTGPTVSFGARAGVSSAEGDLFVPYQTMLLTQHGYTASGKTIGVDVGYHFSPAWTLFGLYEYGSLDLQTSASFDRIANYVGSGLVPIRAALGVTVIATERLRIQAMLGVSASIIDRIDYMDEGCISLDAANCDTVDKGDREVHLHRSLTIGGTFDL